LNKPGQPNKRGKSKRRWISFISIFYPQTHESS
jgi:hypothetical protein